VGEGLAWKALDQIETPAGQIATPLGRPQPGAGLLQIGAAVAASEAGQHGVVEALAAQAHPVDARLQVSGQAGVVKAGGIELQGHLGAGHPAKSLVEGRQQRRHLLRREQRGGAAAEIHRGQGWTSGGGGDLPVQQGEIGADRGGSRTARPIGAIPERNHGEIAVEAAAVAEGDVQVGGAGRPRHGR
jgi:hypothetical protein